MRSVKVSVLAAIVWMATAGFILWSSSTAQFAVVDPTSKALRTTPYESTGNTLAPWFDFTSPRPAQLPAVPTFGVYTPIRLFSDAFSSSTAEAGISILPERNYKQMYPGVNASVAHSPPPGRQWIFVGLACSARQAAATVPHGLIVRVRVGRQVLSSGGTPLAASVVAADCATSTRMTVSGVNAVGGSSTRWSRTSPMHIELSDEMVIGLFQLGTASANNTVNLWGYER